MDAKTQENLRKHGGFAFDFGEIKDEHKKAVEEAIKILQEKGVDKGTLDDLKLKFQIESLPKYDFNKSLMVQFCKKNNINIIEQGFVTETKDGKTKLYPMCAIVEEVRVLDKLFGSIYNAGMETAKQNK
tara:strand:+ start:1937 stop:2323 length:387 start_codon:yes stop_codon:yes gene_type:complete